MSHRLRDSERYTGQMGLAERLGLCWPVPHTVSIVGAGTRRTVVENGRTVERYPAGYDYGDALRGDLRFALRNEALDLGLLSRAFATASQDQIDAWIRAEPSSTYGRRAWFLYEHLTGSRLALPDAPHGNYVPALDPGRHLTWTPTDAVRSRRHRVIDNLPGTSEFCPMVRRTARLDALMAEPVAEEARRLVDGCDPAILRRAVDYLFTKETRSSFEIEGEQVEETRTERFVRALQTAAELFDPTDEADYVALQNLIISDLRYHARGWRTDQNFVGSIGPGYRHKVHYICPRPEDVPALMAGLGALAQRLAGGTDPIVAAALVSFGFVFIHPFDDGNGRIHRFLIHRMLAAGEVTPPGILFPVSATMLRDMRAYDAALESVSGRLTPFVEWRWTGGEGGGVKVLNDTLDLYRFFDATAVVEYLYERVIETVRKDLPEELDFVEAYDLTYRALTERLDGLPGPKISLLAKLCLQNGGPLASGKRRLFPTLEEADIIDAENVVRGVLAESKANTRA